MCETLSFAGLILSRALLQLVWRWFAYLYNDCSVLAGERKILSTSRRASEVFDNPLLILTWSARWFPGEV